MLPRNDPNRIQITFDDHRLVANAGLILPTALARHLGLLSRVRINSVGVVPSALAVAVISARSAGSIPRWFASPV